MGSFPSYAVDIYCVLFLWCRTFIIRCSCLLSEVDIDCLYFSTVWDIYYV